VPGATSGVIFGQEGLVKLAYLGERRGRWKGPCTDEFYPFSPESPLRWVDRRDARLMLEQRDADGKAIFEGEA